MGTKKYLTPINLELKNRIKISSTEKKKKMYIMSDF